MKFLDNITVCFTVTNKILLAAWTKACHDVLGSGYEPTCTSGLSGDHAKDSGHYSNRSLDFRTSDVPYQQHEELKHTAQKILGADYLVLLEDQPVHAHLQRNKNTY